MEDNNPRPQLFQLNSPIERRLVRQLATASEGLLWLSESDYPWQVVCWQNTDSLDPQTVLQHYNYHPATRIVTKTPNSFFAPATREQEWHDETEKTEVKRYQALSDLLEKNLQDLQVYLVGEVEIDVYILGKTDTGAIIGLSTKAIET